MRQLVIFSALAFVFACELAHASPIHLVFSGDATGSIGGSSITAPVTFSFDADTSNLTSFGPGIPGYSSLAGTVDISGVGTFTLDSPLYVFNYQPGGVVGFGSGGDLIDISSTDLTTYGMTTAFGPVAGTVVYLKVNNVGTSGGALTITNFSNPTFEATVNSVPEPSSFALFSLALVGMVGITRRRSRRNNSPSAC